jgi:serine phosphatase RsbU (regulator of sigma subunit)
MASKPDPWAALAAPPAPPEQALRQTERALAREHAQREAMERLLEDQTRDLFLITEELTAERERLLQAEQRERARLSRELEIARRIQSTLLPRAGTRSRWRWCRRRRRGSRSPPGWRR